MTELRRLFSPEAEQAVIGSVFLDATVMDELQAGGLVGEAFYHFATRTLWAAFEKLQAIDEPIDPVTVSDMLAREGNLERVGGLAFLATLANETPSSANAVAYGRVVVERWRERQWLQLSNKIKDVMLDNAAGLTHEQRIDTVQTAITALSTEARGSNQVTLKEALKEYIDDLQQRYENPGIHGLKTGFKHIDYRLGGLQPGNFCVIGARPGMGKTTYVLNILRNVAEQNCRAMMFSLEMNNLELAERMIAAEGRIKMGLLRSAKALEHEETCLRIGPAVQKLIPHPVILDDEPGVMINELCARARREHRRAPLSLVVVDHIGLVDSTLKTESPVQRLGEVSRNLKKLAKELGCVVLGLAQLNREVEKRSNKRPVVSDIRESGRIEEDADVIQLLYRDDVYNPNTEFPGMMEVISGKVRAGEKGTDYLKFIGQYNRVETSEGSYEQQGETTPGDDFYSSEV